MRAKTTYFGDTTLVLAGGGVGGIAFAGACLAAELRGCRFHAAAATSIGAIVATLVAAGFSGRELVRLICEISHPDLLGGRVRTEPSDRSGSSGRFDPVPSEPSGKSKDRAEGGLHASESLQHWMNLRLREKLGIGRPVVTFSDLPRPLMILAADLRRGGAQAWSRVTDSQMPVGLAVRCACTNPFHCPPIEFEGRLLADGSILGNLPADETNNWGLEHCAQLPALVFRLATTERQDRGPEFDSVRSLQCLGDIVISGRAGPPPSLPAPCQQIEIPGGIVSLTDITPSRPAVRNLLRAGYDAVTDFFENEKSRVAKSGYVRRRLDVAPQPTLVDQTMIQLRSARRDIFIAGGDLSWSWELFPILALKTLEGISVRILSAKSVDPSLATTLGQLGCDVRQSTADLLAYGTFIDPDDPDGAAVLVKLLDGQLRGGALVGRQCGSGVLAALVDRFHRLWEEGIPQNTIAQPEFESVEWHVVEQALRAQVVQYRESVFSLQPVEVKDLLPLVQYLGVARLRRADAVADLYERTGRILFEPMCVRGSSWFLAPPVIEIVAGRLALIDGVHRIHHCRRRGIATVNAILVHEASEPPPAKICQGWDQVLPLPFHVGRNERYEQYEESRWRDVRSAWTAVVHQSLPARPSSQASLYPSTLPQS